MCGINISILIEIRAFNHTPLYRCLLRCCFFSSFSFIFESFKFVCSTQIAYHRCEKENNRYVNLMTVNSVLHSRFICLSHWLLFRPFISVQLVSVAFARDKQTPKKKNHTWIDQHYIYGNSVIVTCVFSTQRRPFYCIGVHFSVNWLLVDRAFQEYACKFLLSNFALIKRCYIHGVCACVCVLILDQPLFTCYLLKFHQVIFASGLKNQIPSENVWLYQNLYALYWYVFFLWFFFSLNFNE